MTISAASALDAEDLRTRVQRSLDEFVAGKSALLLTIGEDMAPVADEVSAFLAGGKRLRPAFAYWGWRSAGGADSAEIVSAAASLELLQACALIHDDLMDASDTRRGRPAVHRRFATMHGDSGWDGSPDAFGLGAAVLLGDLCLSWADEMLLSTELPPEALVRAKPVYDLMRTEIMAGQYLDLLEQATGGGSAERARRVIRFKSAKYTVERPLHLGAALADGSTELAAACSAYGLPLGEAFQLRDDVLGVFGDPAETGKPAGDDLREGKRTVLVATAIERATTAQAAEVRRHLGDPDLDDDGVATLREVITTSGALAHVEQLISDLTSEALDALERGPFADPARDVLASLAVAATARRV